MSNKIGLILVNLGSPEAPNAGAVRKYLGEFLHDPRIIDTSRWIWCPILHGVILRVRPARSARAYAKIWGPEGEEAPLVKITREQGGALQKRFGDTVRVEIAMRYGQPSVELTLDRLLAQGCEKIAVIPMYPQYSATTTASVYDAFAKAIKGRNNIPNLRFLRDYHDHPEYIQALANSIGENLDAQPDVILASFHGIPQDYVDRGDPYAKECERTTDLLRDKIGRSADGLRLTFQSRFGPRQWLEPYTVPVLESLAKDGIKNVAVVTPGFAADCLETLEEINMEARESFVSAGGENFTYTPCLNTREDHIDLLEILSRDLLAGWL